MEIDAQCFVNFVASLLWRAWRCFAEFFTKCPKQLKITEKVRSDQLKAVPDS